MQFQAKDYFADWYRAKAPNIDNALIKLRIDAIAKILSIKEKEFWIDLVKINLGISLNNAAGKDRLVSEFKSVDQTFPITENDDLVELLASIVLCFKLETTESLLNNQIGYAIIVSNFLGQFNRREKIPVFDFAHHYISKAKISQRMINADYSMERIAKTNQSIVTPKVLADPLDATQVNTVIQELHKDLVAVAESSKTLAQSNKVLSEETNILWWLIGGQSELYESSFSEVGVLKMISAGATELSKLTKVSLGVPSGKEILTKVLLISGKSKKDISAFDTIDIIPEKIKNEIIRDYSERISEITPLLMGIKISLEHKTEDWYQIHKAQTRGDLKKTFNQSDISYQFYLELLLLRLLN